MGQGTQAFLRSRSSARRPSVPCRRRPSRPSAKWTPPSHPISYHICFCGSLGPVRCVLLRLSVGGGDRYGAFPTFWHHRARQVRQASWIVTRSVSEEKLVSSRRVQSLPTTEVPLTSGRSGNAGVLALSLVSATPVGTVPAATVETEREVDPTLPSHIVYVSGVFVGPSAVSC